MDKIQKIEKLAEQRHNEIAALAKKLEDLPAKVAEAEEKTNAAATLGAFDDFRAAARERDDLKDELEYVTLRLKKLQEMPHVDPEVVKDAWEDFCRKHDPLMETKLAEYQKTMKKALDLYGEMVEMQTEAATVRCRFARITGVPVAEACRWFPATSIPIRTAALDSSGYGAVRMGGTKINDPDAVRYLSDYITHQAQSNAGYNYLNDKQLIKLNGVIGAGLIPE